MLSNKLKNLIVSIVEISIFQAIAMEKHWLLGSLITILIQGIAQDEANLDPYSYKYLNMFKPQKLTLRYTRFSTDATVPMAVTTPSSH